MSLGEVGRPFGADALVVCVLPDDEPVRSGRMQPAEVLRHQRFCPPVALTETP